jgi:hypothetical protein
LFFSNGTKIQKSIIPIKPSSTSFDVSQSSLQSSFVLITPSGFPSQQIVILLNVTGGSASEFYSISTSVELVGVHAVPPPPKISSTFFADAGNQFYIIFDSSTDLGGKSLRTYWTCNSIFYFLGANDSTCTWLNLTTINVALPSVTNTSLVVVGSNVTLLGNIIKPYCSSGVSNCESYNYTSQMSKTIKTALNPISPQVILLVPAIIGGCNNVTVDASHSVGLWCTFFGLR